MSKIEEDFFRSACYTSQEALLDFSKTRATFLMLREEHQTDEAG